MAKNYSLFDADNQRSTRALDRYLGQRLRLARHIAGISQTELAGKVGITFQQLQKYERGANRISASRLYDVAQALRLTPHYFYDGFDGGDPVYPMLDSQCMRLVRHFRAIRSAPLRMALAEMVHEASEASATRERGA